MKVFKVTRKNLDWCQDWGMVVVAKDSMYAERCARCNSENFEKIPKSDITIEEIFLDEEQCILKANTGG